MDFVAHTSRTSKVSGFESVAAEPSGFLTNDHLAVIASPSTSPLKVPLRVIVAPVRQLIFSPASACGALLPSGFWISRILQWMAVLH